MNIIFASGSPRRFELLRKMEWDVEVHSVPFAEAETVSDVKEKLNVLQKHFSRNDLACQWWQNNA